MNKNKLQSELLAAWKTNNRVTDSFFENLPDEVWNGKIPGSLRRTVRMIAGHIHNARCMWIKMIGRPYRIKPPKSVDRRRVTRTQLLRALKQSNNGMIRLLETGLHHGGTFTSNIPWANIPPDVVHLIVYFSAHEAHHRGQIVLAARAIGHPLPPAVTAGLWQWKKWHRETSQ